MISNYELIIRKQKVGWFLTFTQGATRKEITINSLDQIESFLKENCEGHNISDKGS